MQATNIPVVDLIRKLPAKNRMRPQWPSENSSIPVRVYLLKHTANETLQRTTGEQDSGLEPEDPNKWHLKEMRSHQFYRKQLLTKGFNMFNLNSLKVFSSIHDPYKPFYSPPQKKKGLVYKPHLRFLAQNLSKKVRLIYECLRYATLFTIFPESFNGQCCFVGREPSTNISCSSKSNNGKA